MLSDSESSGDEESHQITVNEHFAKAYQARKEREELQKLKDKYGSDYEEEDASYESTDSESAESEDEDGEELTPAVDAAILRTLARIKRKDPSIYESGKGVYEEEQQKVGSVAQKKKTKDKSKPLTLRQVALEAALEPGSRSPSPEPKEPTHVEEQRALRDETIAAFHGALGGEGEEEEEEEDDGGGILVPRERTKDELEHEEEEYKAFLEKEVGSNLNDLVTVEKMDDFDAGGSSEVEVEKKRSKRKGEKGKVKNKDQEDHEFLMNYILNRGWVDKSSRHIPTYKEVTSTKKSKSTSKPAATTSDFSHAKAAADVDVDREADEAGVESDTSFESLVDHFEASYNFRFEEPGAATIQTFPRSLPDTVRRQESTRKDARARRRERKEAELEQKREEVRRLKSLKMKDMRKKLERIGVEGGRGRNLDEDLALQQLDLEGDWDPEAHEKQMAGLYGNDEDAVADEEKPMWEDDIDIADIVPYDEHPAASGAQSIADGRKDKKKKKKKKKNYESDEEDGVDVDEMDADVVRDEAVEEEEEWDGSEEMRKRKLKEYMAELDALDFNDMVGGMPTRFRYVPVKSETFALTPVEILMATDKELNEYMSIKKYAPYRRGMKWDNQRNEKLRELKQAIGQRITRAETGGQWLSVDDNAAGVRRRADADGERPVRKRKGRKERLRAKAAGPAQNGEVKEGGEQPSVGEKRKRGDEVGDDVVRAQVQEGGDVPGKKRKRRQKKKAESAA